MDVGMYIVISNLRMFCLWMWVLILLLLLILWPRLLILGWPRGHGRGRRWGWTWEALLCIWHLSVWLSVCRSLPLIFGLWVALFVRCWLRNLLRIGEKNLTNRTCSILLLMSANCLKFQLGFQVKPKIF